MIYIEFTYITCIYGTNFNHNIAHVRFTDKQIVLTNKTFQFSIIKNNYLSHLLQKRI